MNLPSSRRLPLGGAAQRGTGAALLLLLTLGAACGGEAISTDDPAADPPAHPTSPGDHSSAAAGGAGTIRVGNEGSAAAGSSGATDDPSSDDPNASTDPGAAGAAGNADDASERCSQDAMKALLMVALAEAAAPRACTRDSDCVLFQSNPRCLYGCGYSAVVTDPSKLDAVFTRIDTLCRPECEPLAPPCVPPDPSVPGCVAGQCQFRPRY